MLWCNIFPLTRPLDSLLTVQDCIYLATIKLIDYYNSMTNLSRFRNILLRNQLSVLVETEWRGKKQTRLAMNAYFVPNKPGKNIHIRSHHVQLHWNFNSTTQHQRLRLRLADK